MVTRAHEKHSASAHVPYLCSVPLRLEGEPVAVLVAERATQPFAEVEVRLLALYAEMSARRLVDLKRTDGWFGARWLVASREKLTEWLGPKHTLAKAIGAFAILAAIVLAVVRIDYRVDAPFILRAEDMAFIAAPFNGYLDEVKVDVGDEVKKDGVMASLDTRDLLLEEAGAAAERTRYLGEVEKASGADKPAEMRIAQAQAEQARVRFEIIQYRRSQSNIIAPFDGVIVEGDLRKRIGSPVKQGEVLIRLARTDRLYVECHVNERDIRELQAGVGGQIAFASAPKHQFNVRINRIEPAAQAKETGNAFVVRCAVEGSRETWWRPGMSGVAKLEAGRRTLLWVITHRTVDFLRMHLWW
jgi:RND family efflux transporter MFP subunit